MKKHTQTLTLELDSETLIYQALLSKLEGVEKQVHSLHELQHKHLQDEDFTLLDVEFIVNRLSPVVTEKTVRLWFRKGFIPNRNIGGNLMCTTKDLKDFLTGVNNKNDKYSLTPKRGRKAKE